MKEYIEEALLSLRYDGHLNFLEQATDQSQRGVLPWNRKPWDPNDGYINDCPTDDEDGISVNQDEGTTTLKPPFPKNNDTQLSDHSSKQRSLEDKPRRRATL